MSKPLPFTRDCLRIGTRRSPLAMRQTEMTIEALTSLWPEFGDEGRIEIVPMQTSGDANQKGSLADIGGKGLFAKEIEQALLSGEIDIAVHSMKDMETRLPEGLSIPCMLPRADTRDVLISRSKDGLRGLPQGAVLGTSSVRRRAQLLNKREDLQLVEFRGNLQTRLRKLKEGVADATMLAYAGILRMGLEDEIKAEFELTVLEHDEMLPAGSQGAIGIECRSDDSEAVAMLEAINHTRTHMEVSCERALLHTVDGSCRTPLAVQATLNEMAHVITLEAELYAPDDSEMLHIKDAAHEQDAIKLGTEVGEQLLRDGAKLLKASL